MIIYPALDIREGKCVRLLQGKIKDETIYSDDPLEVALNWQNKGASFLHLVDLDGAFSGSPQNLEIIKSISQKLSIPLQLGGGLRTMENIERILEDLKIKRVILGTATLTNIGLLKKALKRFRERILVGLDAQEGKVASHGWQETSSLETLYLAQKVESLGVKTIIYTDIAKDGMLDGPNLERTEELINKTSLEIIASGGVASLQDLKNLKDIGARGVIIGQALYTQKIDLSSALNLEEESDDR